MYFFFVVFIFINYKKKIENQTKILKKKQFTRGKYTSTIIVK